MFVREDLSKSQQAVQAAHAAIESTKRWPYIGEHPNLVLIGVKDEKKLQEVVDIGKTHCIMMAQFEENGVGVTACATRPIIDPDERKLFSNFRLLRI